MRDIQYRYAYKDGKIVCINNISTHEIFHCISCGREMIAKLGEKRTKHFAHKINVQTCDPNKYLHELTKLVLLQKFQSEDFKIKLNRTCQCIESSCLLNNCKIKIPQEYDLKKHYNTCELEKNISDFRADLLISGNKKDPILIEICVSHKCTSSKINSGLKIIEIPIRTEEDIEYLKKNPISEEKGVRFYGFKRESKEKVEIYDKLFFRFILHKSGAAFVKLKSCKKQHIKDNKYSIFECNIYPNRNQYALENNNNNEIEEEYNEFDDDYEEHIFLHSTLELGANPLDIGLVYATKHNVNVKNCHLCKYVRDDKPNLFCCLSKKYGTPYNPNQKDATPCQYFKQDKLKIDEISNIISSINISKIR